MMFSVDHITGRVMLSSADKWGRWTSQTLQCQQGRKLTVVSAYQVNPDIKKKGVVTAAIQQQSLLLESQDCVGSQPDLQHSHSSNYPIHLHNWR